MKDSKDTPSLPTCDWCGTKQEANTTVYLTGVIKKGSDWIIPPYFLCLDCSVTAHHALELAREVTQVVQKGGKQLYIGVEKIGTKKELLSVKRWSPLEPLEGADSVDEHLATYRLPQE